MNYLFTVEKLKVAKIKYYTLELCFYGHPPEIFDAIHLRSNSVMFHKEQLCHILETHVSRWYTKLLFLDSDIIFENEKWYSQISALLNTHEVVQPFETCAWLDLTYKKIELERKTVVLQESGEYYNTNYHPGFGWAFQRQWFKKNGFYRYAITGSGDTLSAAAWLGQKLPKYYIFPGALEISYNEFKKKLSRPKITFAPGRIFHLYHGTREARKYSARHEILNGICDIRDILSSSFFSSYCFSFKDRLLGEKLETYFIERDDDSIN